MLPRPIATDPPIGPSSRWIGAAVLVAAVAVAIWAAERRAARDEQTPEAEALAAAAQAIDAELLAGDCIAYAPAWSATERWRFADVFAAHGLRYDDAWIPTQPLTPWEVDGCQRLWLLRAPLAQAPDDGPALGDVVRRTALGPGAELLLVDVAPSQTVRDLGRDLIHARVTRTPADGGRPEACRVDGDHQACDGDWWRSLWYRIHEVGHTRRRCVFATPHPDAAVLTLQWDDVPAAERLEGRFGNLLWAVRHEMGSDVLVRVRVGEAVRFEQRVDRGDFDWHAFAIDLRPDERGAKVALELSADDHKWRQFCVDARLVGPVEGAAAAPAAAATPVAP